MKRLAVLLMICVVSGAELSAAEVLLKNSWITKFKNRVTMPLTYRIDQAHKHPNPVGEKSDDGDMHVAGRSTQVGLPFVVEIVNAAIDAHKPVLASIKDLTGKDQAVNIEGAWRLWFEHPDSKHVQQQGAPVPVPKNTNPAHVFEIHPVTKWADDPLDESFVPIEEFTAHDAAVAVPRFEKMVVTVTKQGAFTAFEAKTIGYNYVDFRFTLTSAPKEVDDGVMVLATVSTVDGKTVLSATPRRMVFVKNTPPAALVGKAKKGVSFRALGIPRLNLERLSAKAKPGESIDVQAPYEMIIAAILDQ